MNTFMYELNSKTKEMAKYMLGVSYEEFVDVEYDELDSSNYKPSYISGDDERIIGRGNPLLAREEFLVMDEVDAFLTEVSNANK